MIPTQFRDWRKTQGFTQKQAAEALGLNLRTIALYEAGERDGRPVVIPSVVELACEALNARKRQEEAND